MKKLHIAQLQTPIQKLEKLSNELGKNIYIKRDDFTGTELSGNKVRKIEYSIQYAMDQGYDMIITTGAIQSNHARATAAVCAMVGLECHLILRGDVTEFEGNLFLDTMFGAHIHVIDPDSLQEEAMKKCEQNLKAEGKQPFLIPVGASDALGSYGYIDCYHEIVDQEKSMNIQFDSINVAIGSGGTYAGLWYGNEQTEAKKKIIGYSVSNTTEEFKKDIMEIVRELKDAKHDFSTININDEFVGLGYGQATDEELLFYVEFANKEGIILDPTYTGKAFRGLVSEIKQGSYADEENILFIHTGGIHGYTKEVRDRIQRLTNVGG